MFGEKRLRFVMRIAKGQLVVVLRQLGKTALLVFYCTYF